jgi:hypothetical protein
MTVSVHSDRHAIAGSIQTHELLQM